MGIINAGTAVGAVIAPPLIAVILSYAELALDFCGHRRTRLALDVVVDRIVFFAGESSPILSARTIADASQLDSAPRTCAGLICCAFASPGDW